MKINIYDTPNKYSILYADPPWKYGGSGGTISPELKRCIEVGESWGFKYITVAFVWYKQRANVGNYTMSGCELCLLFKKGKIPSDRVRNPGQKQFISEPVTIHSKKPNDIRTRIEKMYPISKKIELFARQEYPNWDCWGDEVD